jgi:hypothetical protein
MAKKMREPLWKLREDTPSEISALQLTEDVSAWLDEPSERTAVYYANDPATVVHFLEPELSNRALSAYKPVRRS